MDGQSVPFTKFYFSSPVFDSSIFLIYFLEERFPTLSCTSSPCSLKIEARAFQIVSQHSTIELHHNMLPTFLSTLFCASGACNSLVKPWPCLMNSVPCLKRSSQTLEAFCCCPYHSCVSQIFSSLQLSGFCGFTVCSLPPVCWSSLNACWSLAIDLFYTMLVRSAGEM